jgi:hypothetical protein
MNVFVAYFISQEQYIYFWDTANYWIKYQTIANLFNDNPMEALKALLNSIRHDEYNLLAAFFLMPFHFLFGNGRLAFILSITNIYAIPTAFTFVFVLKRILDDSHDRKGAVSFIVLITVMLFPLFWSPVLRGYPDVVGVLVINVILLMLIKKPIEKQSIPHLITIGFLLSFLILLRRWYAYWVVSFFIALALERFLFLVSKRRSKLRDYTIFAQKIFIMGAVSVASFFLFAAPIGKTMLLTNYQDIYSAYQTSRSILPHLLVLYHYLSLLFVLFFLSGVVYAVANKKTRWFSIFLVIQSIAAFLLFARIQEFNSHHYYLLIPAFIFFISFFSVSVYSGLHNRFLKYVFFTGYTIMLMLNFSVAFIPGSSERFQKIAFLLVNGRHYPYTRNDLQEINKVLDFFEDALQTKNDNVYVIASSMTLNDDILRNACTFSNHPQGLCAKFLPANQVDKRDGFPSQVLDAKYVIVTDPVQFHLRPEDQRVIGILADQILSRKGIGSSFKKLPEEFLLDNNVRVFIYEKVATVKKTDLDTLSKLFTDYYPDKRNAFTIHPICGSILKKEAGDFVGSITCQKDSIDIHPGRNNPSKLLLELHKQYDRIQMTFAFKNADRIPSSCGQTGGEINITMIADDKNIFQRHINYTQRINYEIGVGNVSTLEIIVDNGEHGPDCDWFTIKNIEAY